MEIPCINKVILSYPKDPPQRKFQGVGWGVKGEKISVGWGGEVRMDIFWIHTMRVMFFYFFLSARTGGILQILRSDWFRERAVFSHPARSQRAVSDA